MTTYEERIQKDKNKNLELRFVTSVEQITPFLNDLRTSAPDEDNEDAYDDDDGDNEDSENNLNKSNGIDSVLIFNACDKNIRAVALPPAILGLATAAAAILPNIYDEYVNFIDLSVLNPLIDAAHCQKDQLIESEISEKMFFI